MRARSKMVREGVFVVCAVLFGVFLADAETLFSAGSEWSYSDRGDPGTTDWREFGFDDSGWSNGVGAFAYGSGTQIGTTLSTVDAGGDNLLTAYFRKAFFLTNAAEVVALKVDLRRDDGAVVYVNGVETLRDNMPSGVVSYSTFASSTINGDEEDVFTVHSLRLSGVSLRDGTNVIAVEVHQRTASSSDLIFDMALRSESNSVPTFVSDPFSLPAPQIDVPYVATLTNRAVDADGDPMTFSKVSGPEWLRVAPDGRLSGVPPAWLADIDQTFVFRVSGDEGSDEASAVLFSPLPAGYAKVRRLRLSWSTNDPSASVTIGWEQTQGADAVVRYGPRDHGRDASAYPQTRTVTRVGHFSRSGNVYTRFAVLTNLQPDTLYCFVLEDAAGVSPRFRFRTAPAEPVPFTFIAGGDSRSHRAPRRRCNRLVAKLRPLFVAFTGDMTVDDKASQWKEWLDDWQETISPDGRLYPILPHLGNHEEWGSGRIDELFDVPSERYYALSVGGELFRYYVLNTEIEQGGTQTEWLTNDLVAASNALHKAAGYHTPMRAHRDGHVNDGAYTNWAQPFFDYGVELVVEADSHIAKRTWPVEPVGLGGGEDGFVRNDAAGTVYVGEGCWGASLRTPGAIKSWTRATGRFYGFQWVHVYPGHMELFTPQAEALPEVEALGESDVFSIPAGLRVWNPAGGARIVMNHGGEVPASFAQWQIDQWGLPLPDASSMNADPDGDGLVNLAEYSYGLDPSDPAPPDSSSGIVLPRIDSLAGRPAIRYRRRRNGSLNYRVRASTNLSNWVGMRPGIDYSETAVDLGQGLERAEVRLSASYVDSNETSFVRIRCGVR